MGKQRRVLLCRYAWEICRLDVCKWIGVAAVWNLTMSARTAISIRARASIVISRRWRSNVDAPYQVKRSAGKVVVGARCPERDKVARQTVIADRIEKMYCLIPVGDKVSRYEQIGQLFVGLGLFRKRNGLRHFNFPIIKMPAETIGRNLPGGVTGSYCTKSRRQKQ